MIKETFALERWRAAQEEVDRQKLLDADARKILAECAADSDAKRISLLMRHGPFSWGDARETLDRIANARA